MTTGERIAKAFSDDKHHLSDAEQRRLAGMIDAGNAERDAERDALQDAESAAQELADLVDDESYTLDSFTTQPVRAALAKLAAHRAGMIDAGNAERDALRSAAKSALRYYESCALNTSSTADALRAALYADPVERTAEKDD